jgi:hypothetical protein
MLATARTTAIAVTGRRLEEESSGTRLTSINGNVDGKYTAVVKDDQQDKATSTDDPTHSPL